MKDSVGMRTPEIAVILAIIVGMRSPEIAGSVAMIAGANTTGRPGSHQILRKKINFFAAVGVRS
jgi:hypothetical protein